MKTIPMNVVLYSAFAGLLITLCPPVVWAQRTTLRASEGSVSWQVTAPNNGISLRLSQPDGTVFAQTFSGGQAPAFTSPTGVLPDGSYTYELRLAPIAAAGVRAQAEDAGDNGKQAVHPAGSIESGSFRIVGGLLRLLDASDVESNSSSRAANNPQTPEDTFGTVTIQALEPVLFFDDLDSPPSGFAYDDWRVRANLGGTDKLSFENATRSTIPFTIRGAAPTDSLYVAPSGFVGLGTATPVQALHLVKPNTVNVRLEETGPFAQAWDLNVGDSGFWFSDITHARTQVLTLNNADGFVGIGTGFPAGHLHVRGAGNQLAIFQSADNMAVQFRLQTNSTNRRFVALNAAGTQQSQLLFGDNGAFDFLGPTASDVRMRLLANGNVGIGTTAPTQKLSVNGSAGKPGGGSWSTFSDERLKDIKGEFTSGLDAVMKLKPIRYEYKIDNAIGIKSEGEHIGFGAQAVQKIIPEAVTKNADGYLMVDNDPILWTMLNAIKEQNAEMNAQNAQLRTEIKQLKEETKEIAQLKEQLARLQAEVVLQAGNKTSPREAAVAKANR